MTSPGSSRRRAAPVAVASSDVTRFRAFGAGALALASTVVALLALGGGPSSLVTPGPLARPHRDLACAACHEDESKHRAASACVGCHGTHASARPAHAALAQAGTLGCESCHAVHRAESGLAFEVDGGVSHYGTGFEKPLRGATLGVAPFAPNARAVFVPLVSREACERCHALDRTSDPAWACFSGRERGRIGAYSVCFDEHRRPAEPNGARTAERDGVVERARELAPRVARPRAANLVSGGATLAVGALAAGLVVVFARRRAKRAKFRRPLLVATSAPGARRLPIIDAARCLGCHGCVDACAYDVLEMSRYVAVVSRPEQCCSAGSCLVACPNGSLALRDESVPAAPPRLSSTFESLERPGVFFAGDASGGSLIRSALEQGVAVARAVAEELARGGRALALQPKPAGNEASPVDLVAVGAGPAGLAAGLEAERRGLSVVVLEQASVAESIRRYSREKLVLDGQPAGPGELPLWIGDSKKEELLRRWLREVRARDLDVREGARVVDIEARSRGGFLVRAAHSDGGELSVAARRVLVATGRRGSPRKLEAEVPEAALGRVHYELSDARAFAGRRTVVVGLGDVAMESALALALQPGTAVTLLHRGNGFSRGRQLNVERTARLVAEGRIGLLFEAEVRKVGLENLLVDVGGSERSLAYDALFVHIGTDAPDGPAIVSSRR